MEDLKNVLQENLEYYREQEKSIIGILTTLPKGRLRKKKINGDFYYYLQFRRGKKIIDKYIGKEFPESLSKQLEKRKKLENELKEVREAIKLLTKEKIGSINLIDSAKKIFEKLTEENLWEQGIEIIGSWCFILYQKHLDFPKYPLKTNDMDILVPLPYKGKIFDLSSFLKSLGFRENFNPNGSTYYSISDLKIEFLSQMKREKEFSEYINSLGISPQQLKFLDILFINPITIKISRNIKVKVPSPASFFLHKLLISKRRREKGKREKDLKQAVYTGKYILTDLNERNNLIKIFNDFPESWKKKVLNSLREAINSFTIESDTINQLLIILNNNLPYKS